MLTLLVLVFFAVFAVAALLLTASRSAASKQTEQTMNVLNAAFATRNRAVAVDQIVDIRKEELLSAVPLLTRLLLRLEIAPRLRTLLYQADLQWTAGGLILMSIACFLIPAYLLYLRTGVVIFSLLIGILFGAGPFFFVLHKRTQRFNKFEQGLPDTLDLMVSALRAGHSLVSALDPAASDSPDPIGTELRICFDEQNYGLG